MSGKKLDHAYKSKVQAGVASSDTSRGALLQKELQSSIWVCDAWRS